LLKKLLPEEKVQFLLMADMRKLIFLVGTIFFAYQVMAQSHDAKARYDSINKATILSGDSIPHVELKEIAIIPPPNFSSRREARKYWKLVYNLKRVLPYARIVNTTLAEMEVKLSNTVTDRERRLFIKSVEDSLWTQYEPELRKMTITQGKLLFKLVDKESSQNTYYWIEHYKGSFSAFFWQGVARLFGTNLKSDYDPNDPEDIMIDKLVKYIDLGYI